MFIIVIQQEVLAAVNDTSSCAEVTVSAANSWCIFHNRCEVAQCGSVGGRCQAPFLAAVANWPDDNFNCSKCGVSGLLTQRPWPSSPICSWLQDMVLGKTVTLSGGEGEKAVALYMCRMGDRELDIHALPACLPCPARNNQPP